MDFVDGVLPSPASARLARWRLAKAAARAVADASLGVCIVSLGVLLLCCSDDECPVHRAAVIVFIVSLFFTTTASRVSDLLGICVARSKIKDQEAAAMLKSLGAFVLLEHLAPPACLFLGIVSMLLRSSSANGSLMEAIASGIVYVAIGIFVLVSAVVSAAFAALLCTMLWLSCQMVIQVFLLSQSQHSTETEPSGESCEDGQ